ncbi:MAG: hypothetical protein ACRYGK_09445 [Janthinobacterium lividum]
MKSIIRNYRCYVAQVKYFESFIVPFMQQISGGGSHAESLSSTAGVAELPFCRAGCNGSGLDVESGLPVNPEIHTRQ